ncbi:MAG TPA: helix-turn-helix domain-containing protein [Gaiellaceae bacterium]|nr:helix-turn-helix domain-containing protein [Gaiellaceae bacterium]
MDAPTARHRALADERRRRIVEELRSERDGLDAGELARRLELHPNTVRWHLGVLADAGIVRSQPAARTRPGRPRILYTLTRDGAGGAADEHRLLATIFAGALSDLGDGATRAEEAGRAWGRYLMAREPLKRATDEEAVEGVVGLLEQQGFAPTAEGRDIHMHRCPFHDLAEAHPEVVCPVHEGLMSGALAALGSDLEVEGLDVFVRPDLCVARLR